MIAPTWPAHFRRRYGDKWPDYYLAWDVETSGFNMGKDVILEIGHVLVEKGQVVDRGNYVVDWRDHAIVPADWLRWKIGHTADTMAQQGKKFHCTWDRMCTLGVKPDKVFPFYMRFFADLMANHCAFAGHNLPFDEEMFGQNAVGFGYAVDFALPDDKFWDTHAIEKANQMVDDDRAVPRDGESLRAYFTRIGKSFGRIKSNLDQHCFVKYKFAEKGVKPEECHGAGADAFMVHLLMEAFRGQATVPTCAGVAPASPPADGGFEPQEIPWDRLHKPHVPAGPTHPVRYRGQRNS